MQRQLSDWIGNFLKYTSESEARDSYREWVAISMIASCLQRKCYLDWGLTGKIYPNMYIVLVGPAAARKSTAIKMGRPFIEDLEIPIAPDQTTRQALVQKFQECFALEEGTEGHASLTAVAEELPVLLSPKTQVMELLSNLVDWYDCNNRFAYMTVGRGEEPVNNLWFNLLGATTVGGLESSLPSVELCMGFISRVVFIYEDGKKGIVIKPEADSSMRAALLHDLRSIHGMSGEFTHTDEFLEVYSEWRQQWDHIVPGGEARLEEYAGRRPTHLRKLCIISSASRRKKNNYLIDLQDFEYAADLLEETEERMPNVFQGLGQDSLASVKGRLIRALREKKRISYHQLVRMFAITDLKDVDQLDSVLKSLEEARYCRTVTDDDDTHFVEWITG